MNTNSLPLDPPWRQAVEDAAAMFDYGDPIEREWLMDAFMIEPATTVADVDKKSFEWLQSYIPFRDTMLEVHKKALRPLPGLGYEVVLPGEQTDYGKRQFQGKVKRAYERYRSTIVNVEITRLNQEQAQHNAEEQAKLAAVNVFITTEIEGKARRVELTRDNEENDEQD